MPIAVGKRRDAIPRPRNIAEMNPAKRRRLCAEKPGKGDPVLAKLAASTAGGTHRSQLAKLVAAAKKNNQVGELNHFTKARKFLQTL